MGLKYKVLSVQEEVTKNDDAVIPYNIWDSWLKRIWDVHVLPPPGVANATDVIRERFAL
jgi:hypothetical protein